MLEQWIQWEPVKNLSNKYYIESISDNYKEFKIIFCNQKNSEEKLSMIFQGSIGSYKWTDETFRLKTLSYLDEHYPEDFYSEWTFFKVIHSSYLKILSEESCGISDSRILIHFSFIEHNAIFDIIASSEPTIKIYQQNNTIAQ